MRNKAEEPPRISMLHSSTTPGHGVRRSSAAMCVSLVPGNSQLAPHHVVAVERMHYLACIGLPLSDSSDEFCGSPHKILNFFIMGASFFWTMHRRKGERLSYANVSYLGVFGCVAR